MSAPWPAPNASARRRERPEPNEWWPVAFIVILAAVSAAVVMIVGSLAISSALAALDRRRSDVDAVDVDGGLGSLFVGGVFGLLLAVGTYVLVGVRLIGRHRPPRSQGSGILVLLAAPFGVLIALTALLS